jgi:hypothetical protein
MTATPPMVDLGTATNFAVLAGSAITNTGSSVIYNGDIGLSPGTSVTGFPPGTLASGLDMTGAAYVADAGAVNAQTDATAAYVYAAGQSSTGTISADLGGQTLTPGVYTSGSSMGLTGTLTLNGEDDSDAVFIFQMGSTLTTAVDSTVYLENGVRPCHVFWQVGSSATLGAGSTFNGTILALTSITVDAGVTVYGRLLASTGAVTLISDNITNTICEDTGSPPPVIGTPVVPPLITVTKIPAPLAFASGGGLVTYTYTVTNPGMVALSNVTVTDNKVSPVTYVSGDTNNNNLLDPGETWIYTGTANVTATTMDTATATGTANGLTATATASATVVVAIPSQSGGGGSQISPTVTSPTVTSPTVTSPTVTSPTVTSSPGTSPVVATPTALGGVATPTAPGGVVTRTVTGGQLPKTSTPFSAPMYELLLIGAVLTLVGAVGWRNRKRYE